ncbi:phosphopantothenoylcysteine decarboxylase, partial [Nocardia farcinica]|uniref:phosphopantothenoylcysteine decarboxylase domain-containing protein n=1 Tax=Nocardia farcinica TaxID=37329 RepID=UPI003CC7E3D8
MWPAAPPARPDDLLTATLLTARCPVLFAPAMHTEMWEHPATQANVETLRRHGAVVMEPASGRLTGTDTGPGRLPEPEEIFGLASLLQERQDAVPRDLVGRRLVITAGGTREPLDPVRFLGNRSSGKQGYALARVAAQRGAQVTLIAGNTIEMAAPAAVELVHITTAEQLKTAVDKHAVGADAVIMAAAVADFRPTNVAAAKIKKGAGEPDVIPLTKTDDILAGLVQSRRDGQLPGTAIVGLGAPPRGAHRGVLTHPRGAPGPPGGGRGGGSHPDVRGAGQLAVPAGLDQPGENVVGLGQRDDVRLAGT